MSALPLPEPNFIDRDPDVITADLVAKYEAMSGKTLYPAQVERLLIDLIAYAKTMTHIGIQEAGKQNLVHFSGQPIIDYLGELIRVPRLSAASAATIVRFSIAASLAVDVTFAAGTQIDSSDGKISFITDAAATLSAGQLFVDTAATCATPGTIGNGWQPGQISVLASDAGDVAVAVANTTISANGADDELTEPYRARLMAGPESFTVAGSYGAYRFHAMSAHQSIIDVGIIGPKMELVNGSLVSTNQVPPGAVFVYPLTSTGAPNADIIARVAAVLSAETVRPLCDWAQVFPPIAANYVIHAGLTLYSTADETLTLAAVNKAAQAYAADRAAGVGRDVVVSDLTKLLKVTGVYDIAFSSLPANLVLTDDQWANCTDINIAVTGVNDG